MLRLLLGSLLIAGAMVAGLAAARQPGPAAAGTADLVITNVAINPSDPVINYFANVSVTVANRGTSSTGQFWVDIYYHRTSPPPTFDSGDVFCRMDSLGANASAICTADAIYEQPGPYSLWVRVDTEQEVAEENEINNVSGPHSIQALADTDDDSIGDPHDNCPSWPNSDQALPPWPVPANDPDCDGFSSETENFIGTIPSQACAASTTANDESSPDRWPLDMNDNKIANTNDAGVFVFHLNSIDPDPRYNVRLDFNMNGRVNTLDLGRFVAALNATCTP